MSPPPPVPASLELVGAPGSPYSRKMRALLRYRQIPFRWVVRHSVDDHERPSVPVDLIPVLVLRGADGAADEAMIDSTFQIRRLEALQSGRSVVQPDPALAFFDQLIEDYADEWLTKAMFHYRWAFDADIAKAAGVLPRWSRPDAPDSAMASFGKTVAERQIGRLWVVGSNETTGPVIETSYRRLLRALDAHLTSQRFVLGRRPAASDFALFGQLSQLALFDPTPMAIAVEESPRVVAWCEVIEDLSGVVVAEDGWNGRDDLPDTLRGLFSEIGRTHAPFLIGNAAALASGAERVVCEIDGREWVQKPFPYQGKCLRWLREAHASLLPEDRSFVDTALAGTGCEILFAEGP